LLHRDLWTAQTLFGVSRGFQEQIERSIPFDILFRSGSFQLKTHIMEQIRSYRVTGPSVVADVLHHLWPELCKSTASDTASCVGFELADLRSTLSDSVSAASDFCSASKKCVHSELLVRKAEKIGHQHWAFRTECYSFGGCSARILGCLVLTVLVPQSLLWSTLDTSDSLELILAARFSLCFACIGCFAQTVAWALLFRKEFKGFCRLRVSLDELKCDLSEPMRLPHLSVSCVLWILVSGATSLWLFCLLLCTEILCQTMPTCSVASAAVVSTVGSHTLARARGPLNFWAVMSSAMVLLTCASSAVLVAENLGCISMQFLPLWVLVTPLQVPLAAVGAGLVGAAYALLSMQQLFAALVCGSLSAVVVGFQ